MPRLSDNRIANLEHLHQESATESQKPWREETRLKIFIEFFREWLSNWLGLMSGAVFTFLGIYAAGANKSNTWVLIASAVAGSIMLFVASFRAWRRQHDKADSLQEKANRVEAAVFGGDPIITPPDNALGAEYRPSITAKSFQVSPEGYGQ